MTNQEAVEILALLKLGKDQEGRAYAALDTAIALMRAAEPKDEAAERHHCAGQSALACREALEDQNAVRDRFVRERAAVRAERAEELATTKQMYQNERSLNQRLTRELAALKAAGAPKDEAAEREHCRARAAYWVGCFSAEQADLEDALYDERAAVRAEMQAEIDRLKDASQAHRKFGREVSDIHVADAVRAEGELSTLREAARRTVEVLSDWNCPDDALDNVREQLRKALEGKT